MLDKTTQPPPAPHPRAKRANFPIVHRTSYIVHRRLRLLPAQRAQIWQVDSPAPPCHGCFGVASRLLLRSRLTTPHPFGAKAMLLAKLTYSRRQFSPFGQRIRAVHTRLPPSCVLYLVHGRRPRRQIPAALLRIICKSYIVHRTSSIGSVSCHRRTSKIVHRRLRFLPAQRAQAFKS